jgi:signal transduction histidine kinase
VPLNQTLTELEALVAPQLNAKGLSYNYCSISDDVTVWADRDKLEQIVVNLLTNAIKFTPSGSIEVKCHVMPDKVEISVTDTGVGMAPDKLSLIFDPFVQLNAGLTRTSSGSGLGLAISRELARAMGGDVEVQSEPGKGSTFTLSIPRNKP